MIKSGMNHDIKDKIEKETLIIGLGNPLLQDEGIGAVLMERLQEYFALVSSSNGLLTEGEGIIFPLLLDLGTSSPKLLHAIAGRRKVILVDCAYMGERPGTIRRFTPEEVKSEKELPRMSLHEGDLLAALELSKALGEYPEEVILFGIEPESTEEGIGLSQTLERRCSEYVLDILKEV